MHALLSKSRRPKFALQLKIIDLNNVPLVSGTCFVKWHLPSSKSADHRGRTPPLPVTDHKVQWNYKKELSVRITIDKSLTLQECHIDFEVVQDYGSAGRGDKIILGRITLNLAEYVELSGEGEGEESMVVRRYLMQNSKINSTLNIGIGMRQLDGERNYVAPPLKTAPVFGGIAGIMSESQLDFEDTGVTPQPNRYRETGEAQDMYRKSLAASWAALAGELPADKCIENIFAGGDGWGTKIAQDKVPDSRHQRRHGFRDSSRDDFGRSYRDRMYGHSRNASASSSQSSMNTVTGKSTGPQSGRHKHNRSQEQFDMREFIPPETTISGMDQLAAEFDDRHAQRRRVHHKSSHEVSDLDIREDLVAWKRPAEPISHETAHQQKT